jgi:hypothetical protein
VEGLTFVYFDESDVVRHHLVQRIIRAYDEHKARVAERQMVLSLGAKAGEGRPPEGKSQNAEENAAGSGAGGPGAVPERVVVPLPGSADEE